MHETRYDAKGAPVTSEQGTSTQTIKKGEATTKIGSYKPKKMINPRERKFNKVFREQYNLSVDE